MKNKPSTFLKQIFSFLSTIIKAKAMAMRNKTSVVKNRLLIFNLLRNKNVLLSKINHKIHAIVGENYSKAIVLHNNVAKKMMSANISKMEDVDLNDEGEEDDYPDLRHSFFEMEDEDDDGDDDEIVNGTGSVIDLVRNSKGDGNGFSLEDEIDHVADVFIRRFHREMRIQKQESFNRYREMLARGV